MTRQEQVRETVRQIYSMFPERKEAVYKISTPLNTQRVLNELTDSMNGLPTQVDLWNKEIKDIEVARNNGDINEDSANQMINLLKYRIRMFNRFKRINAYYPEMSEVNLSNEVIL